MQEKKNRSGQRLQVNSFIETNRLEEERRQRRLTSILLGIVSLALPPVGLLLVWRSKNLTVATRALMSAVSLCSMTLIFWLWLKPAQGATSILPVPVVPQQAGYDAAAIEPTTVPVEVVNTVPDTPSAFTVTYGDGSVDGVGTMPVDPASYVTIVYAVADNPKFYHNLEVCDNQANPRVMTLDEAIAAGLLPCEKCVLSSEAAG